MAFVGWDFCPTSLRTQAPTVFGVGDASASPIIYGRKIIVDFN